MLKMNKSDKFCHHHTVEIVEFLTTNLDPDIELPDETSKELVFKIPNLEN